MVINKRSVINANASNLSLGFILALALLSGCVPPPAFVPDLSSNPIDVIERSPRIYHIEFSSIAESLSISMFTDYIGRDVIGGWRFANGLKPDDFGDSSAISEYLLALTALDEGNLDEAIAHLENTTDSKVGLKRSYTLLADMLRDMGEIKSAMQLYFKALSLDATNSYALSGLARCLLMIGDIDNARNAFINALIFNRSNFDAWEGISLIARQSGLTVKMVDVPEMSYVKKRKGRHFDLIVDESVKDCPAVATAWIVYASQRAAWRYEGKYKQQTMKSRYNHTLEEDVDCYMTLAAAWKLLSNEDKGECDVSYLSYLIKLAEEGYLIPHILFDYSCARDPLLGRRFKPETVEIIRSYIENYIIVPEG
ncbi:MAG: tetratricopeptide repeat protein [bacterium]